MAMNKHTTLKNATAISALLIVSAVVCALVEGCISSPSEDPPAPSGGQAFVLDFDVFATEIDSILTANGCDNLTCHGGGIRGTFELSPVNAKDIAMDFAQASLQVNGTDPASSTLLMKPLAEAAGGAAHAADPAQFGFTATSDPGYQAILAWIEAGEYR